MSEARRRWMGVLAKAPAAALAEAWAALGREDAFRWLREPEIGAVMVRGRAGGTGAAFNLGEMTVTRCALQLEGDRGDGIVGHAYVAGREPEKARIAALCDALMQTGARAEIEARVIAPLAEAAAAKAARLAAKADATRVDFFTVARGED